MTTGEKVIFFIEEFCRVPEGKHVGGKLKLDEFQKRFILDVYDNPKSTKLAILSIARKNGKTVLIAALCMAHVAGPVAVQNSQIITGAMSREQAGLVFKAMSKMIMLEPRLQAVTRTIPSSKSVIGLRKNVEFRAISAEAQTAHGLSPIVAVLDEVGQVRGPQSDFVDAIVTSQGAHDKPLLFVISTQAANNDDLLSIWIDDALDGKDKQAVCHLYAADKDCDLMDKAQWKKANPAFGEFRSADDMEALALRAKRMPSFESTFRNLNLNQRVEKVNPFVSRDVWELNAGRSELAEGDVVYGGLDLSSVADLTALVLVNETYSVSCTFWLPEEGISDRSKDDRVPYDVWAKQGHLSLVPGRTIQYEYIARELRQVFDKYDVKAIAFDRYNMRFLKPWLEKAGFTEDELGKFVEFGQGYISMSPALRELESLLLDGRMRHGGQPVLRMCATNAVTVSDPAGNRKLVKNRRAGRIDGMVSLAMAVGVRPIQPGETGPKEYQMFFV